MYKNNKFQEFLQQTQQRNLPGLLADSILIGFSESDTTHFSLLQQNIIHRAPWLFISTLLCYEAKIEEIEKGQQPLGVTIAQ